MKTKKPFNNEITSTPSKRIKKESGKDDDGDNFDSTTPDPTQPDTEITYNKKHQIGDPIKKKRDK